VFLLLISTQYKNIFIPSFLFIVSCLQVYLGFLSSFLSLLSPSLIKEKYKLRLKRNNNSEENNNKRFF
jgi:flagellar motor switch protein FliM